MRDPLSVVNALVAAVIAVSALGASNYLAAAGWFVACIGWATCYIEERRSA